MTNMHHDIAIKFFFFDRRYAGRNVPLPFVIRGHDTKKTIFYGCPMVTLTSAVFSRKRTSGRDGSKDDEDVKTSTGHDEENGSDGGTLVRSNAKSTKLPLRFLRDAIKCSALDRRMVGRWQFLSFVHVVYGPQRSSISAKTGSAGTAGSPSIGS